MKNSNLHQVINVSVSTIANPVSYLQPCPESHNKVIKHYQENAVVESLPKTRLFRLNQAPDKPPLLEKLEQLLRSHSFSERDFRIGFTGYGDIKTHLAEIGLVSTTPGFYNLHLGGNRAGNQLNRIYRINAPEAVILNELQNLLAYFKIARKPGERFGEFVSRKNLI